MMTVLNSQGRQNGWQEIIRCSRFGEQELERVLGLHCLLLIMKQTPPPLDLSDSSVLSAHKTEKVPIGQITQSGTSGLTVSNFSVKQKI